MLQIPPQGLHSMQDSGTQPIPVSNIHSTRWVITSRTPFPDSVNSSKLKLKDIQPVYLSGNKTMNTAVRLNILGSSLPKLYSKNWRF